MKRKGEEKMGNFGVWFRKNLGFLLIEGRCEEEIDVSWVNIL